MVFLPPLALEESQAHPIFPIPTRTRAPMLEKRPRPRQNIYRIAARLSIAIGIACNVAAIVFTAIYLSRVDPAKHDLMQGHLFPLALIAAFSAFTGGTTAVVGWIDPASSRLAKWGFFWSITPIFAGGLTMIIFAMLARLTAGS